MNQQQLYFIAIVLPPQLCAEITHFKEDFVTRFNSRHALRVKPHITLKAPFSLPAEQQAELHDWFTQIPVPVTAFQQELKDFGAFDNRRNPVIYVHPVMNNALYQLQKEVLFQFKKKFPKANISQNESSFHPHITIAYRDLQPHLFKKAWEEYKTQKYEAVFEVSSFELLQHKTKSWETIGTHALLQ